VSDEQVTVSAAWLAELERESAELKATNAVLVEFLEDIAELEGNPRVGFFVAQGMARKALEDQGGEE